MVIVNCNREHAPQTLLPVGACCVAAASAAAGHETQLLDAGFTRAPARVVRAALREYRPDVVALSIRNLDNCDAEHPHSYLPEIKDLVAACRQAGAVPILGGAAVSLAPAAMLRYLDCRLAVAGEGERAFPALLRALADGADPASVPGVVISDGREVKAAPPQLCDRLDDFPPVDYTHWLALRHYRARDAAYPVQTKRGCARKCSYCVYPRLEGSAWRLFSPGRVAEEVRRARLSGLRLVEFVDGLFGLPSEHALACCSEIARAPAALPLCTMDLNPAACTPEMVEAMNAAGFTAVGITADSGSGAMLAGMRKGFTVDLLHRAAAALRRLQARKIWFFLLGAPGECEATMRETARFITALPPGDLVYATFGVRVLPGSDLHRELLAGGVLPTDDDLLWPRFYFSPRLSPQRAREILAESGFPSLHYTTLHDGGHRLLPIVHRVLVHAGLRPPYWRHLPWLNRIRRVLRV
ncbi:MAG: B12-binding domain-containing radical SAM protein [Armatimonadota bacterium]